ncbi:MAG: glutamyl-tRNA reductase [candidate division Zixibacteria bacterium]|nr:glutamyl-tRNA reductase [candidate division Zixibacteria bacterium]
MVSVASRLVVCGISHKSSSIEQREPFGFTHDNLAEANATFSDLPEVIESCIISTCNRVEFYFVAEHNADPFEVVASFYRNNRGIDIDSLQQSFYTKRDRHAADQLFRVTGGLDSMVLGENQIMGQVKEAYGSACAVKATGKVIHRLFHQAFRVGKQIRSGTEMGKGACSISSASVDLIKTRINGLKKPSILFIGVNQMIVLAASNLVRMPHSRFVFANRTSEKAVTLADRYDGVGCGLENLSELLENADLVVSCTGSEEPIITAAIVDQFVDTHPGKKLIIMDMAIPRDVECEKGRYPHIDILDLEDVKDHVGRQQKMREAAIPQAETIVEERLNEFIYWFNHVRHERLSATVEESFEQLREQALTTVVDKLSPELQLELTEATRSLVRKLVRVTARTCSKCSDSEK